MNIKHCIKLCMSNFTIKRICNSESFASFITNNENHYSFLTRVVVARKDFQRRLQTKRSKSSSRQSAESRSRMDLASKRAPERGMKGCTIQKQRKRGCKSWGEKGVRGRKRAKERERKKENVDLDENNSSN